MYGRYLTGSVSTDIAPWRVGYFTDLEVLAEGLHHAAIIGKGR